MNVSPASLTVLHGAPFSVARPPRELSASFRWDLPASRHLPALADLPRGQLQRTGGCDPSFRVNFPATDLVDLRRRVAATRWPGRELVSDATQGVQLATMQKLAQYWANDYDWRKVEARLNALPQFVTTIDGLDIHFIQVRSKHANALPVIVTHRWPGSIIEQLKVIGPLTDPTACGGKAEDAFDVVVPSLPGDGFSGKPATTGLDPARIARAWTVLMKRLGYTRYVAQGGDWGNAITETMALQAPQGLIGIHTNMAATVSADIEKALQSGGSRPTPSHPMRSARGTSSISLISTALVTPKRWRAARRLFTQSRIRRSAWPPGSSTTTQRVMRSSLASSTVRPRDRRGTTS